MKSNKIEDKTILMALHDVAEVVLQKLKNFELRQLQCKVKIHASNQLPSFENTIEAIPSFDEKLNRVQWSIYRPLFAINKQLAVPHTVVQIRCCNVYECSKRLIQQGILFLNEIDISIIVNYRIILERTKVF